jgi:hypothetical protein
MDVTEQYAEVMNEAIAAASKAEAQRDAAQARVVELEQQVQLWQGDVTLPTVEDCWRVFCTQFDFEVRVSESGWGFNPVIHYCPPSPAGDIFFGWLRPLPRSPKFRYGNETSEASRSHTDPRYAVSRRQV